MKSPIRREARADLRALDPEVLDREGRALLEGEMAAVARANYAEALRLNSLRLRLAEQRHAELLRRVGSAGPACAAPGFGRSA